MPLLRQHHQTHNSQLSLACPHHHVLPFALGEGKSIWQSDADHAVTDHSTVDQAVHDESKGRGWGGCVTPAAVSPSTTVKLLLLHMHAVLSCQGSNEVILARGCLVLSWGLARGIQHFDQTQLFEQPPQSCTGQIHMPQAETVWGCLSKGCYRVHDACGTPRHKGWCADRDCATAQHSKVCCTVKIFNQDACGLMLLTSSGM